MRQVKRRMTRLKGICLIGAVLVQCYTAQAQRYEAPLPQVIEGGFYKVLLTPDIVGRCRMGVPDVRLLDSTGKQVPYVSTEEPVLTKGRSFVAFPMLSFEKGKDGQMHLIVAANTAVSSLVLKMRNTEAERSINISGSNDRQQWFAISEHVPLLQQHYADSGGLSDILSIPISNYRYYDITILGKNLLPPPVYAVGVFQESVSVGNFCRVPNPVIIQKDSSDGRSYIRLLFDYPYKIDRMLPAFSGARYYHRKMQVSTPDGGAEKFTVASNVAPSFGVSWKVREVWMIVENGDSPPLRLDSVSVYQTNSYLLAYMEKGSGYKLVFGDSAMNAPVYDLDYFKISAVKVAKVVMVGDVRERAVEVRRASVIKNGDGKKWLLWVTLIAVCGAVAFVAVQMTNRVNRGDDDAAKG